MPTREGALDPTLGWWRREGRIIVVGGRSFGGRHYGEKTESEEGLIVCEVVVLMATGKESPAVMDTEECETSLAEVHLMWDVKGEKQRRGDIVGSTGNSINART